MWNKTYQPSLDVGIVGAICDVKSSRYICTPKIELAMDRQIANVCHNNTATKHNQAPPLFAAEATKLVDLSSLSSCGLDNVVVGFAECRVERGERELANDMFPCWVSRDWQAFVVVFDATAELVTVVATNTKSIMIMGGESGVGLVTASPHSSHGARLNEIRRQAA